MFTPFVCLREIKNGKVAYDEKKIVYDLLHKQKKAEV